MRPSTTSTPICSCVALDYIPHAPPRRHSSLSRHSQSIPSTPAAPSTDHSSQHLHRRPPSSIERPMRLPPHAANMRSLTCRSERDKNWFSATPASSGAQVLCPRAKTIGREGVSIQTPSQVAASQSRRHPRATLAQHSPLAPSCTTLAQHPQGVTCVTYYSYFMKFLQ